MSDCERPLTARERSTSIMRAPAFWLIMLLALTVRLSFMFVIAHPELRRGEFAFTGDEPTYHETASTLAMTGRYARSPEGPPTGFRTPGAVLPLAALYLVTGPNPIAGLVLSMFLGLLLVLAMGEAAQSITGSSTATWAALLFGALAPSLIQNSTMILSDTPATLCTIAGVYFLAEWFRKRELRDILIAALLIGWAYLARPSVVFLVPLLILWLVWQRPRVPAIRHAAVFAAIVALVIAPWIVRNYVSLGVFCPGTTVAGRMIWESNNPITAGMEPLVLPEGDTGTPEDWGVGGWIPHRAIPGDETYMSGDVSEWERHEICMMYFKDFVREHPTALARLAYYKLGRLLLATPASLPSKEASNTVRILRLVISKSERWFSLLAGAIGLALLWRRERALSWLLIAVIAGTVVYIMTAYASGRFFMSGTAALLVAGSEVASWLHNRHAARRQVTNSS